MPVSVHVAPLETGAECGHGVGTGIGAGGGEKRSIELLTLPVLRFGPHPALDISLGPRFCAIGLALIVIHGVSFFDRHTTRQEQCTEGYGSKNSHGFRRLLDFRPGLWVARRP